jgi:RNA polymerase sigma-70 factor (ECF subfamily)
MDKVTEEELIGRSIKGDRRAQKSIYDALSPKMFSLCLRYTGDRAVAEDILQDGFITLFGRLDSYAGKGSFEGWARKIFVNTALMYLRKTDALKLSGDIEDARSLDNGEPPPGQQIGYKELLKMITSLDPSSRTVFNMHVIEGYSHKEIADSLGITEATSRSKLQRARLKLQDMIRKRN